MIERDVDILIVGGGLVGALLLIALKHLHYRVLLVDTKSLSSREDASFDARSLALSPASARILQMLMVWPHLENVIASIEKIHVSEQGCFGRTLLQQSKEPLGYVVEIEHLTRALLQALPQQNILAPAEVLAFDLQENCATIRTPDGDNLVRAQLIVAADGAASCMRQFCQLRAETKNYDQYAIVANLGLTRSHHHIAYERFTKRGPLALLPMSDLRAALIWSMSPADAQQMLHCSEQDFLRQLQQAFGYRLGRLSRIGTRHIFPIQQVYMSQLVVGSVVFIGNAAHTLHPVAGQGFNLGLRDVAMLAQCITEQGLGQTMLQSYQQLRRHDQQSIRWLTDNLITCFTGQTKGLNVLRGCGLLVFDQIPLLKTMLTRYAQGFGGVIPDLVCGISIET